MIITLCGKSCAVFSFFFSSFFFFLQNNVLNEINIYCFNVFDLPV